MSGNLYQAFGPELVTQRRVQLEQDARHGRLVRRLRRERKADRAHEAAERGPRRAPCACCAADVG
jgi:hypothetical protein